MQYSIFDPKVGNPDRIFTALLCPSKRILAMNDNFHINTTVHRGTTFGEDFEGSSKWLNFKALSRHLPGGFEENHEKPLSG